MSRDDVIWLVHHEGSVLPLVRLCDTANSCNKKTHWTAEELHWMPKNLELQASYPSQL